MIKGGGQGGLKRKKYRPQVSVALHYGITWDIQFNGVKNSYVYALKRRPSCLNVDFLQWNW